jgi:rhodanese-related sulfurtransferase
MRTRNISLILALGAILMAAAPARSFDLSTMLGNPDHDQALDTFKLIHVSDLKAAIADPKSGVQIYDANVADTREQYGVIPGAHLLPSADSYSVAQELPADKNADVVFYCANTSCMASHQAARRAVKAGYTDVSVMADGIMGWKSAGQPTVTVNDRKVGNS